MSKLLKAYTNSPTVKNNDEENHTAHVLERCGEIMKEAAEHIERNEIENRFHKTDRVLEVLSFLKSFDYAPQTEEDKRFVDAMINYYDTASYFVSMVNIKNDKVLAEQMAYSFQEMSKTWLEMERQGEEAEKASAEKTDS